MRRKFSSLKKISVYYYYVLNNTARSLVKGTLSGATVLVAGPLKGAYEGLLVGGTFGAFKGFGMGIGVGFFAGSFLVLEGTFAAMMHVLRGVYNTPNAIASSKQGFIFISIII
jgi:hypothetical protein